MTRSSKERASRDGQRDGEDGGDEAGGDLDAVRALDDVGDRGVDEDQRDDAEADGRACAARRAGRPG